MFQRIIVPLDGSERARQALPVAARIASESDGSLCLLRVQIPPVHLNWQMETEWMHPESREVERREMASELVRLASSEELEGREVVTEVVEGLPVQTILEQARIYAADLIVLCSHGRSGITRWALGSVAQKVVRHSTIPVLVLRAGYPIAFPSPEERAVRVMVALDGSPLAESALLPAARLSAALSAPLPGEVHLVRVIPFSTDFEYGQEDSFARAKRQAKQEALAYLQTVQQQLAEQVHVRIISSVASSLDTAFALVSIAETGEEEGLLRAVEPCDLIALATRGRSGPARWMVGSIAERILSATRMPLLVVHPSHSCAEPAHHQKHRV